MRKILITGILMIFCFVVIAQTEPLKKMNAVKISPIEFGRAEFKLSYERYFKNRKSSVLLSPTIILKGEEGDERLGWRALIQYRYYLSHLNKENGNDFLNIYNIGLYTGLYGLHLDYSDKYVVLLYDEETAISEEHLNERNIQAQEAGAIVGLQLDITKNFLIDFYIGGGIRISQESNSIELEDEHYAPNRGGIFPYAYKGVKPSFGLMIGFLF